MSIPIKLNKVKHVAGTISTHTPKYILRLFVSGMSQNSGRAIKNLNQICELHLKNNYELQVIDIYQQPEIAISEQLIVIPVLVIKAPLPERRIIGDLSNTEKVLEILNIE